jgi:hypothetical protein
MPPNNAPKGFPVNQKRDITLGVVTKPCPECKTNIPQDARRCLKCGAKITQWDQVVWLFTLLGLIGYAGWFFFYDSLSFLKFYGQ